MRALLALTFCILLPACTAGGFGTSGDGPYPPGHNPRAEAQDGLIVGHRLMQAGEFELALQSFRRAAVDQGLTADILAGMGSANLGLGRLGQSETLMRRAIDAEGDWPELWNNLGVVLMERQKTAEAVQAFRRAYGLDNGESDSIRDNLRLSLEKLENPAYSGTQQQDYKLVRRGSGDFLISQTP